MSFRNFLMMSLTSALLGSIAALGCVISGDDEPPGVVDPFPTASAFCQAVAEAECNDTVVEVCSGATPDTVEESRPNCITARRAACNPENLPKYNSAAAPDCIAKRKDVIKDAILSLVEIEEAMEACLPVLSRGGVKGSTCSEHIDCDTANDLRCIIALGDAAGICDVPESIPAGDDCSAVNAVCQDGYYCDTGDHCVSSPGVNATCSATVPCADGLKCSLETSGVCLQKADDAQPCMVAEDCSGGFCLPASTENLCSSTYRLEFSSATCDDYR